MGREVRKVPADWQHPNKWHVDHVTKEWVESYIPLLRGEDFEGAASDWDLEHAAWASRMHPEQDQIGTTERDFDAWDGPRPRAQDYMPDWTEEEKTHYMLYETTSEGTPMSPAFATLGELCEYAEEHCTVFADFMTTAKRWREMLEVGLVKHTEGEITFM